MNFNNIIFVGLTFTTARRKRSHWKEQLKEINQLKIKEIALFPTVIKKKERKEIYQELERSTVKRIPLVHLRGDDWTVEELKYFYQKFKTRLFNCHEKHFDLLYQKFPQYRKNIVLELNYDGTIENKLEPNQAGGFCIDLAHFKAAKENQKIEYDFVMKRLHNTKFQANHLNGYNNSKKRDLHFVTNIKQFNYLKDLPKEIFSKVIGLELENSIKKQLEFKKYIVKLLDQKFRS